MAAGDATIAAGTTIGRNIVRFTGTFGTKGQAVGIGMVGVAAGGTGNSTLPAAWMEQTGTGATAAAHEGSRAVTGATLNQNVIVKFNWLAAPASTAFGVFITKDFANGAGGRLLITDDAGVDPAGGGAIAFEVYVIYPHSVIR